MFYMIVTEEILYQSQSIRLLNQRDLQAKTPKLLCAYTYTNQINLNLKKKFF